MTNKMIPADKVRDLRDQYARLIEDAGTKEAQAYYGHVVDDLDALLPTPPRPTLADMTDEERDECVGMQADLAQGDRVVILDGTPDHDDRVQILESSLDVYRPVVTDVTPRPDLPRMEWPGTEKPAPAPALPEGWRLADHSRNGRVIVTTPTPTPHRDGRVYYVLPDVHPLGHDWLFCDPSELTFLDTDQGADQ